MAADRKPSGVPAEDAILVALRVLHSTGYEATADAALAAVTAFLAERARLAEEAVLLRDELARTETLLMDRGRLAEQLTLATTRANAETKRAERAEREAAELRMALEVENERANQLGAIVLECVKAGHVTSVRAALASAATGGREGEADTDAREWDATLMRGLDATAARDPGCMRHTGDPHNLCPECWKAEAATGEAKTT